MAKSLDLYGLAQPKVFYTDNVQADRQFLMKIFPSLSVDVIPSEKYRHLPSFEIPPNVVVEVCSTRGSIDAAARSILQAVPRDGEENIVVGFDCEWNTEYGARERVVSRGPVAVIQIAYKTHVFVLQVRNSCAFILFVFSTSYLT